MARKKRWEISRIENGIAEVKLLSWRYFTDYVRQEMLDYETYIWRGQRNSDWDLVSTLDRLVSKARVAATKRSEFRRNHLDQFQYAVRGRRGPNPPIIENENEWWALGQHHGLATPLLDWTTSPFVAAYFSFIGQGLRQTRFRSVFALNRTGIEKKVQEIKKAVEIENKEKKAERDKSENKNYLLRAMYDLPVHPEVLFIKPRSNENQRLVNQNGLFSRAPDGINLNDWVANNFKGDSKYYRIIKILIPNSDREECLRMLNRMNINHLTLFPDISGASIFCNLFAEIKNY